MRALRCEWLDFVVFTLAIDSLRVIFASTMSCYYGGHYTRNISERCYYSTHYAVTLKVLAKMPSRRLCAALLFLDSLAIFLWAKHFGFII